MPEIGEIKSANEIGREGKGYYIWHACIECGKERWVRKRRKGEPRSILCQKCAVKNTVWKGESWRHKLGKYIEIKLYPGNFFFQ